MTNGLGVTVLSSGRNADLGVTSMRTSGDLYKGPRLLVIERGMEGFTCGSDLEELDLCAQDTSELFFEDVRVPAANMHGEEGSGFMGLMRDLPKERLSIAVGAVASKGGSANSLTCE